MLKTKVAVERIEGARDSACPHCNGPIARVPRRVVDRLMSLIRPRHRYRCVAIRCDWIGNLRQNRVALLGD
jgi:uncharacterized protein with PIN domain